MKTHIIFKTEIIKFNGIISSHSLDFSELVKELENWEEFDPETLTELINLKLSCSEEFKGFTVPDVLESLLLRAVGKYVSRKDSRGLAKVGKLIINLDIHGVLNRDDLEFEYPLISPSVSLSLHKVGLIDLGSQLDVSWKNAEKNVKRFLEDFVDEVVGGEGQEITQLLVRVGFNKQEEQMRRKRANILLEKMFGKVLGVLFSNFPSLSGINIKQSYLYNTYSCCWKLYVCMDT